MLQDQISQDSSANDDLDLPDSHDIHWTASRKADVVRAVRDRLITFDEARWRYLLSRQEFKGWQKSVPAAQEDKRELEVSDES